MAAAKSLAEQSGGRFILGLGVSHRPLVEGLRGHAYGKPVTTMNDYLEKMSHAIYGSVVPDEDPPIVLAALGLNMLSLASARARGAIPYFTPPAHTAIARETMGPESWLCVEQKVILESDPARARELGRNAARTYTTLENYRNNWMRLGFDPSEIDDGGNDRFIDAMFAWGGEQEIRDRLQAHLDAGASHVCVQPVNPNGVMGDPHWPVLELVADMHLSG
jgi:probable F420-dependent oxidoreductase